MTKSTAAVLVFLIALNPLSAPAQTLREIAERNGGSATGVISVDEPISRPADLISLADLVVHGRVTSMTTRLDTDERFVITEYTIAPIQAFKQQQQVSVKTPGTMSKLVVQHFGGSLTTTDGLRLSTDVNIFPESETFRAGEEVVLFLQYHPDTGIYSLISQFGAYRIRNGVAALMTAKAAKNRGDQPIASSALFGELQAKR